MFRAPSASDAFWALRGILKRMDGERHRRGRAPRYTFPSSHYCDRTDPRPPPGGSRYGKRKVGRAVSVTPLCGVTGEPYTRRCNANPVHSATHPPLRSYPRGRGHSCLRAS